MNNDYKNAVKGWLEVIMPSVASIIADNLDSDVLNECAKEQAIHGPYTIDIEEMKGPITSILFHVMVVDDMVMMSVNGNFRSSEQNSSDMKFDMVFSREELVEKVQDEEHLTLIVEDLIEQMENASIYE